MDNYFIEYKLAKLTLAKMAAQFYDCDLSLNDAGKHGIKYNKYAYRKKSVNCCFHRFEPTGKYIWDVLGIEKPIIAYDELLDISGLVKSERETDTDYYRQFLEMSICINSMIMKYYGSKMSVKDAKGSRVKYDKDFDVFDGNVDIYYHLLESAGESAWKVLGYEEPIIASSVVVNKQNELTNKLLELTYQKQKTLSK